MSQMLLAWRQRVVR